jgi:hypothetical protein
MSALATLELDERKAFLNARVENLTVDGDFIYNGTSTITFNNVTFTGTATFDGGSVFISTATFDSTAVFEDGILLENPNISGYTPTKFQTYEEASVTCNVSGAFTGTVSVSCTRIGRQVTLRCVPTSNANTFAAAIWTIAAGQIPARFLQTASDIVFTCYGVSNNVNVALIGSVGSQILIGPPTGGQPSNWANAANSILGQWVVTYTV